MKIKIKIIKANNKAWYRNRIGEVFDVLEESEDYNGELIYIVHKGRIIDSFVRPDDCEVLTDKQ